MRKLFLFLIIGLAFFSCDDGYKEVEYNPAIGDTYSVSLSKGSEAWTYDFRGLGLDDSMADYERDGKISQLYAYYYNADVNLAELARDKNSSLVPASYYLHVQPAGSAYQNGEWRIYSNLVNDLSSIVTPSDLTSSFFVGDVFGMQDFPEFDSASQIRVNIEAGGFHHIFEGDPNGEVILVEKIDINPNN